MVHILVLEIVKITATRFRASASVRNEVTDSAVVEIVNEIKTYSY